MACEFVVMMANTVNYILYLCHSYLQNISWCTQFSSYSNTDKFKMNCSYLVSTKRLRAQHYGAQTGRASLED